MFSAQMATAGVAIRIYQHGLQMARSIATYLISSEMSVSGATVQKPNSNIMSRLTSNNPGVFTTYIERSAMQVPRQPMPNSQRHVHRGFTVFEHIPCIVSDIRKPNHLHSMEIGMLDYLQKWIFHFMKTHERLD
jgi:hypothetical protein